MVAHRALKVHGGAGEGVSDDMASKFAELVREVTIRDGVRVFAWGVLPNHYHLALQAGPTPLARTMKTL